MIEVYTALMTRWNAGTVKNSFPGGLWYREAKARTTFPYAVVAPLPHNPSMHTSNSRTHRGGFQITIFSKEDGTNDPASVSGALQKALVDDLHNATLTLADSNLMSLRSGPQTLPEAVGASHGVWRCVASFTYMVGK